MAARGISVGYGVRVVEGASGPVVVSGRVRLGWRPREGRVPGTAVRWDGRFWEVVRGEGGAGPERWFLEPWADGAAPPPSGVS